VGVSISVFRVMLSVSGLRTFAITASSAIPSSGDRSVPPGRPLATHLLPRESQGPLSPKSRQANVKPTFPQRRVSEPVEWKNSRQTETLLSPWETPAGNGWLEGGRSSLLESAQEATLSSVATYAFPSQSNRLAEAK